MKLEVNGQIVEVDDSFEKLSSDEQNRTVNEIAASIGSTQTQPSTTELTAQITAPALTGSQISILGETVGLQPTGLGQMAQDVRQAAQPLVEAGKSAAAGYARSPGKAIVDVGAAHLGLPPPYATYEGFQGAKNLLGAAGQTSKNLSEVFSKLPPGTDRTAAEFINALRPADQTRLLEAINSQGLEKGIKSFEAPRYLTQEAIASLNATKSAFPSGIQKLAQVVGPLARGAARVAGPAGMAYDLYEAYPHLQTARAGAQPGDIGQRIQQAQQQARTGYGVGYQGPQLAPQEAQNVLSGGSARDIKYFGGQDRLQQLIRQKAAERVLGPVAPGTF